ncbi:polysaccharide deacetylase family protein [Seonamhaeicola marinus]|uniref:Polysaccharide deacetylase family protein n=1 Tax=Seonamhaeicola marinus TaxID=1912246 RepID=A0A5D0HRP9_9FLAO|nr:polysaccharide deacetylase family protein [Seonamhaeicola marinus]TYA73958.1 polysaccharide deacetylase family protein [Seonamhaeicola marinus]
MLKFKSINILFAFIVILLLVLTFIYNLSFWFFIIAGLLWFIITSLGSALIGWNYHITSLNKSNSETQNRVAITFDDGPNPEYTLQALEVLKTHNAKATFFCIGKHIEKHPEIVSKILEEGHTIGNHTYSHSNFFGFFGTQRVKQELQQTNYVVQKLFGLKMSLYRPAFGVTNPNIKKAIKAIGLISIGWNKRSLDTTKLDTSKVLKRVTSNLKPGDVILLHDTSHKTIEVLEQLLLFLHQQNMKSVSVDTLFNIKAYA